MIFKTTILMIIILLQLRFSLANYKNPYFLRNRTTIVHLFEWTWTDIAKECTRFLGPHGYAGVQISPVTETRKFHSNPWWARYQPISYRLHSRSGSATELRDMIATCNSNGVRVYVDVVINHMTGAQSGVTQGTAGSVANYNEHKYPAVPYGPDDFHPPCVIVNYNDPAEVRNCQLVTLLDLNQKRSHVRDMIVAFLNGLIDIGVAGFRVDAAKHMWPEDLHEIYGRLRNLREDFGYAKNARPYIYQEVIDLGVEAIKKFDYNKEAAVTEFKFSSELGRVFRGKDSLKWLPNWGVDWGFLPSSDAVVFVDNHDNQRGHGAGGDNILTHKQSDLYQIATIFMLAHPYGQVARVMSSFAFNNTDQGPPSTKDGRIAPVLLRSDGQCDSASSGWICEHRWPSIRRMVQFRNAVNGTILREWWDNGNNQIAFARGHLGFVAINLESNVPMKVSVKSGLAGGTYCDIVSGERQTKPQRICRGRSFQVDADGSMQLELPKGPVAMAIYEGSKL